MTTIYRGMPGTVHQRMVTHSNVLLKYKPHQKCFDVVMLEYTI
ncbi:hypothetical protein BN130_511 [Cronobacter malonaticus 507]|nr:hypothetical protein BN130_511 [Cronobacter malonaticus 507]